MQAKLQGFLIDIRTTSEENLSIEVDASSIPWAEYNTLISELQDILAAIDKEHSVRSWLIKGRSLRGYYRRVSAENRQRHLRFTPFPSRFATVLKNLRAYMYALVGSYCLVLESVGNRKVYLLPKQLAPFFLEAVDKVNREVIEPLKNEVEKFRQSQEYLNIQQCLYRHGVDPSALKVATFNLHNYIVDVLPVDFGYSVSMDDVYAKMKRAEAARGLEILRKQIERKYREYTLNAVSDITGRIMELVEGLEAKGRRAKNAHLKVGRLIEICDALGLTEVSDAVLKPLKEICSARTYQRPELAEKFFGTKDLRLGVEGALKKMLAPDSFLGEYLNTGK